MAFAYRRELDGLRAIAVVPVVLFHAGVSGVDGGYTGVDVFFVISGFLITSIILAEQAAGTFSLVGFYERRVRRILPALFTVMLASTLAAWLLLVPDAFASFGKSMASTSAFGSNIFFWRQSGYFAPAAEDIPLLHTWSLAVEEQYYLLFPLLLLLLAPLCRRRLATWIAGIALVSLVFAQWGSRHAPDANFYLLPSRAWELMAGALLAVWLAQRDVKAFLGVFARNVLSALGLALILSGALFFDKDTPIPSLHAAGPVAGAVLVLATATSDTVVGRALGWGPVVFVGLISYSIYLWHVPLLSFARAASLESPSLNMRLVLVAATFPLAYATWRFVERPFRAPNLVDRRTVFAGAVCVGAGLGAAGLVIAANDGFRSRFHSYYLTFEQEKERARSWDFVNRYREAEESRETGAVRASPGEPALTIVVIGNSHAKDIYNVLLLSGLKLRVKPIITNYLCEGLRKNSDRWKACNLEYLVGSANLWFADKYIIAPRWDEAHIEALPAVIERLKSLGKDVAVFGNAAEFEDVPVYFAKSIGFAGDDSVANLRKIETRAAGTLDAERLRAIDRRVEEIALRYGATYIDRRSLLCTSSGCTLLDDDLRHLLYDYGHLTLSGAKYVAKRLLTNATFMSFLGQAQAQSSAR